MKLFGRTGGYWLFWTGFVYFWVGMYLAFTHAARPEIATATWVCVLALPFVFPPLGRWLNLDVTWDKKMFDFFRRKTAKEFTDEVNNVYNLPPPKLVSPTPEVEPPKKEPEGKVFYRLGLTDNNRISFQMGYSEITMNKVGCQQIIDQLEFFQSQLYDEGGPTDDPDGGLPLPEEVEKAKAA